MSVNTDTFIYSPDNSFYVTQQQFSNLSNAFATTNLTVGSNIQATQAPKVFCSFAGTGSIGSNKTILSSFNVSTVANSSTGVYQINFNSALTNIKYTTISTSSTGSITSVGLQSTGSCILNTVNNSGVLTNSPYVNCIIFNS